MYRKVWKFESSSGHQILNPGHDENRDRGFLFRDSACTACHSQVIARRTPQPTALPDMCHQPIHPPVFPSGSTRGPPSTRHKRRETPGSSPGMRLGLRLSPTNRHPRARPEGSVLARRELKCSPLGSSPRVTTEYVAPLGRATAYGTAATGSPRPLYVSFEAVIDDDRPWSVVLCHGPGRIACSPSEPAKLALERMRPSLLDCLERLVGPHVPAYKAEQS